MLNYGYGVLYGIIERSVVVAGLDVIQLDLHAFAQELLQLDEGQ